MYRLALRVGQRVFWFALRIGSADVTNSDGRHIAPFDVSADRTDRTSGVNTSVKGHDIVISDIAPSAAQVPSANRFGSNVASFGCRAAVNNDFVNVAHLHG